MFKEEGNFSPVGLSLDCVQIRLFKWLFLERIKPFFHKIFFMSKCIRTNTVIMEEPKLKDLPINEQIKSPKVMVIDADGTKMGEIMTQKALEHAKSQGLDLVLVSPNAVPQVCKIMDYGKYKFDLQKKQKDNKKTQKNLEMKQIKLSMKISEGDLEYRAKQVLKFAERGYKVKVYIERSRGRAQIYDNKGLDILRRFAEMVSNEYKIEKEPSFGVYDVNMILTVMTKKEKELKNAKTENE